MTNEALQFKQNDNHIFKKYWRNYITNGFSVIPDKWGSKQPCFKSWNDYCYRLPTTDECQSWSSNLSESNIALCLGRASNIVALDIDTTDQRILDLILPLLPPSPVEKVGAKGFTRFFRYSGEQNDSLKYNGEMVIEILSEGKKTTLPPSLHVNGSNYKWTGSKELLEIDKNELPLLPPFLFGHIMTKLKLEIPETQSEGITKVFTGRHLSLSSLCGKLINDNLPVDSVIRELIKYDEENHKPPIFTDPNENRHTEAYTNALNFYATHLNSINTKRFRENKEYELPVMQTVADFEKIKEIKMGKSQGQVELKKERSVESLPVHGAIKIIYQTILSNSWIKQPDLTLGATLTLFSTLCSRKVVFQGLSPNLYVLNVSASGSGKDVPQQMVKSILMDIGAEYLLGAGDYVSDASLMDSLPTSPVRLDIMDEAGGILRTVNSGKSDYNGKMADVLAELYTTSNNKYLGRATAEGRKGGCYRPNVNILASTTPTGFMEGVSLKAIEKGLMGRFLIFMGRSNERAIRLKEFPKVPQSALNVLRHWASFKPEDYKDTTQKQIGGIPQNYIELKASDEANIRLDQIFTEFDTLRIETQGNSPMLPIISRLYQQMVKLAIISSCSRCDYGVPEINLGDVEFSYLLISYYYETIKEVVDKYIFSNAQEKDTLTIINLIKENGNSMTKADLSRLTRSMNKRQRDQIIEDLLESEQIIRDVKSYKGKNQTIYFLA